MKTDLDKQNQILWTIGLRRFMVWQPPITYDESKFKNYVTSKYKESQLKETDEIYSMFEFNLLHIESGLRLKILTSESYNGSAQYMIIRMFIITSSNNELDVIDANFENKNFYTTDLEIPFAETNKSIE